MSVYHSALYVCVFNIHTVPAHSHMYSMYLGVRIQNRRAVDIRSFDLETWQSIWSTPRPRATVSRTVQHTHTPKPMRGKHECVCIRQVRRLCLCASSIPVSLPVRCAVRTSCPNEVNSGLSPACPPDCTSEQCEDAARDLIRLLYTIRSRRRLLFPGKNRVACAQTHTHTP